MTPGPTHHVVIVRPHYLNLLLSGRKRIECRMSAMRKAPYGVVRTGDVLWLKPPSRDICGVAIVGLCEFHEVTPPGNLARLLRRHEARICAEPGYFDDVTRVRYVSFIGIRTIARIQPMAVQKRDQRAWVVLDRYPRPGMRIGGEVPRNRQPVA